MTSMEGLQILLWLIFVGLASWYGNSRKLGLGWTLGISILLSPLIGFIAALVSGKKEIKDSQL